MLRNNKKGCSVLGPETFNFIASSISGTSPTKTDDHHQVETTSSSSAAFAAPSKPLESLSLDENKPGWFRLLSKAQTEYEINSTRKKDNFLKGCKWSPDGSFLITNSDDNVLRLYDTNSQMLNDYESKEDNDKQQCPELTPSLRLEEPEIIYDFACYPRLDSSNPLTACVFSTCKNNPIHLFDAYTGKIRCSYMGYNHLDELVNAYSISFNSECNKLYCGYNKCIKVFDISRPGKNYYDIATFSKTDPYKIPGIISCIAFSPTQNGVYAVGSYSKYIGVYIESSNEVVFLLQSHNGGLTHLAFSGDGNRLYSGARKYYFSDSQIFCWDIRNPGKLLQVFKRNVRTNQRIYFDQYDEKYLCSGNYDGSVSLWQANPNEFSLDQEFEPVAFTLERAHGGDCVNGVSFHPTLPLLATASGQRHLKVPFKSKKKFGRVVEEADKEKLELPSSSSSDEDDDIDILANKRENSLKIWKHNL